MNLVVCVWCLWKKIFVVYYVVYGVWMVIWSFGVGVIVVYVFVVVYVLD